MTGRIRVLCVDDDAATRALVRLALGRDVELHEADTGHEALRLLPTLRPDVVLLDVCMPGLDGYATCARLRAESGRDCRVILMSGRAKPDERLRGYEAGADDFLGKPLHAGELRAKVRVFGRLHSFAALDRMKGDLLAILAHELRTPLTGILPAGEVLSSEEPMLDGPRRMWGEIVACNGRRLSNLAERGILLWALRSRLREARIADADLGAILRDVVADGMAGALARGCQLQSGASGGVMAATDAEMLAQAILGLVDSAILSCGEGALVEVSLATVDGRPRFVVTMPAPAGGAQWHDQLGGVRVREADGQLVGADLGLALAEEVAAALGGRLHLADVGRTSVYTYELSSPAGPVAAG